MNIYQVSLLINSKISEYEVKAQKETNVAKLNEIFDYISFLKVIKHHIETQSSNDIFAEGRRVAHVKAKTQSEALAALDILRSGIDTDRDDQNGKVFEGTVYVTNEGVAWGG